MTPATKRLCDPRLPAGTGEHLCDDHAAEALDERPDDGLVVTPDPPGTTCDRCAQVTPAPLDLDAIEARAKAATPGPWLIGGKAGRPELGRWLGKDRFGNATRWCIIADLCTNSATMLYIAGMDPSTTLAIVAEARQFQVEATRLREEIQSLRTYERDL